MNQISPKHFTTSSRHNWYPVLLAGCSALTLAAATTPLHGQEIIDGGAHEIVNGNGGGTQPSPWIIGTDLHVGQTGTGDLTIENGGRVQAAGSLFLGFSEGSSGSVTVTGEESEIAASSVIVGRNGYGVLSIENGASVYSRNGVQLGFGGASVGQGTGNIYVQGEGSSLSTDQNIIVGRYSDGMLWISEGGKVSAQSVLLSGTETGAKGSRSLTIEGTSAARGILETDFVEKGQGTAQFRLNGGVLRATRDETDFIRGLDTGDMTIDAGGAFIDSNGFDVGVNADMQGTGDLHKTGEGALSLRGGLDIGGLDVQSGELGLLGGVNLLSGAAQVDAVGQPAKLSVDGQSTSLEANALTVGRSGAGLFDLTGGAQISMPGLSSANALVLGHSAGSEGQGLISGLGSRLQVAGGTTRIGREGDGSLQISDGGRFESGYLVTIGDYEGGKGNVSVSGDGSAFVTTGSAPLYVGASGTGTLEIVDGGYVETSFLASVGRQEGGDGRVLISGEDTNWFVDGNLKIGEGGKGTVVLTNGGHVDLGDTSYSHITLGTQETGSGTLVIGAEAGVPAADAGTIAARSIDFSAGSGTLVFNHTDDNYVFGIDLRKDTFNPAPNGDHSIQHLAGHTTFTGDSSQFDGTTTISGGTLDVDGRLGGMVNVSSGGTLGGSGTVGDTLIAQGGILAPGKSMGALTVDGDLTLTSGSILDFELGGAGASVATPGISSRVNVTGDLGLNGTLNLTQSSDPADGEVGLGYYRLMTYGGTLSGDGLILGQTPNIDNADYLIDASGGNVDLFIAAEGDDTLQHWQGGDGVWSATNSQWLNKDGEAPVTWAGNHAVFKNEPGGFDGGAITVEGTQSFKGLQFIDEGYRLEGDGALKTVAEGSEIRVLADSAEIATEIAGVGAIVKTEAGTLILSGTNSYTGGTELRGGTLSVSSDASLGDASSALTFNGGVLQVTGNEFRETEREIVWGAQGGGFDIADVRNYFHVGQNIVGDGDLLKTGQGSLRLSGDNAYGNTLIREGQVFGNAGSISGDIGNAGTVVFEQETDATFAGNIGGFDGTYGTIVKLGAGTLTLTGASNLDWTIGTGGVVTAAERFGGNAGIVADASLTFEQNVDAAYRGVLEGAGNLIKTGAGALLYDGVSADFTGTTYIAGGTLIVGSNAGHGDALLGGSFNVENGGTLGGHGTVGSGIGSVVTIASGGTLSPGNSIGMLAVDGDLIFDAGSTYRAEINPALASDLVTVTGTATIDGGTVYAQKAGGIYTPGSRWTILDAAGGVSGVFDALDQNMPFVDLALGYDANHVYIDAERNAVAFCDVARTRNQCATGNGLESTGVGNPVYDAVAALPDEDSARHAFDQLSGEIHASAKTALIEDSHFVRDAATDRIRAAFRDVGSSRAPVMAYDGDGIRAVAPTADRLTVWAQGFGAWGHVTGDGNAARLSTSTGGFLVGADAPVFDTWRLGALAGYSHSSFNVRDRHSSGSSDNYHLGLYGGTRWADLGFRTGLAYTWHDIDTARSVAFPGFADSLRSSYRAGTFQAFGDLGYRIDTSVASFEPFANLAYVSLHTNGFNEQGGAAALRTRGQTTDITFSTLGLRASASFDLAGIDSTVHGSLGWRHAYGDTTPLSTHAFSAGNAFTVAGVPIAEDAGVIKAGLDMALTSNAALGLSYDGQIGSSDQQHGFKANFNVRF